MKQTQYRIKRTEKSLKEQPNIKRMKDHFFTERERVGTAEQPAQACLPSRTCSSLCHVEK
jgi:hypothetical protein